MMKRVWKDVVSLKEGVGGKFILDSDPDNLERVSKVPVGFPSSERQDTIIIRGRILPTTYPYNLRSFRLEIVLPYDYPFKPPNMLLRSTIYHPNLDENGYLCIELLDFGREWSPVKTISKLVEAVADLIDKPRPDEAHCQQIVDEYLHHFEDFQIKALRDVLSFGDPRD